MREESIVGDSDLTRSSDRPRIAPDGNRGEELHLADDAFATYTSKVASSRKQFVGGVLIGVVAWLIFFRTDGILGPLLLLAISWGLVVHAPCILPNGEHGATCAGVAQTETVKLHPASATVKPVLVRPWLKHLFTEVAAAAVVAQIGTIVGPVLKPYMPTLDTELVARFAVGVVAGLLWPYSVVVTFRKLQRRAIEA